MLDKNTGDIPSPFIPEFENIQQQDPFGLTKADRDEITKIITQKTKAKAFILILNSEYMPCPEEVRGETCKGHSSAMLTGGIKTIGLIRGFLKQIDMKLGKEQTDNGGDVEIHF